MAFPNINGWIQDSLNRRFDPNAPRMGPADPNAPFISDVPPEVSPLEAAGYGALAGITAPIDVAGFNLNPIRGPLSEIAQTVASQVGREHDVATPIGEYAGMALNPIYQIGGKAINALLKSAYPGVNTLSRDKFLRENPLPPRQASNPGDWDWEHFAGQASDVTPQAPVAGGLPSAPDAPMPAPRALPSPSFAQWKPEGGPPSAAPEPFAAPTWTGLKEGFSLYKPSGAEPPPMPEYLSSNAPEIDPAELKAVRDLVSLYKNAVGKNLAFERMGNQGELRMSPVPLESVGVDTTPDPMLPPGPQAPKALGPKQPWVDYVPGGSKITGATPAYYLESPEYLKSLISADKIGNFHNYGTATQDAILSALANAKVSAPGLDDESIKNLVRNLGKWEFIGGESPIEPWSSPTSRMSLENTLNRKTPVGDKLIESLGPRYNDAFRKWYEGTKAGTEEGKPRVWFHGTRMDPDYDPDAQDKRYFKQFRAGRSDIGAHFGTPEAAWQIHGKMKEDPLKKIYPVLLSLKNPVMTPDLGSWGPSYWVNAAHKGNEEIDNIVKEFLKLNGPIGGKSPMDFAVNDPDAFKLQIEALKEAIRSQGFDSVMYQNTVEDPSSLSYIAMDPQRQVKSLFNQGTWDPNDPDMMKALLPPVGIGVANELAKKKADESK